MSLIQCGDIVRGIEMVGSILLDIELPVLHMHNVG